MDILGKYRVPLFQAPDIAPGATPPVVMPPDPSVIPPVEPPAGATIEPQKTPQLPSGVIDELTKLRAEKRELGERAARLEREASEARALAERAVAADKAISPPTAPRVPPAPTEEAEIDRRAEYKLFQREVSSVITRGQKEFGLADFNETVRALQAYGADSDQFVSEVMAVDRDNAHKLLHTLAHDGAQTIGLLGMTPAQRLAELTRMHMAAKSAEPATSAIPVVPAKPAVAATVSAAPRPAPVVEPSAGKTVMRYGDERSDAEFTEDFKKWETRKMRRR
jgi:hypothetical protein